jgi:glucose-1-phosphate thymidylyltransferase
MSEYTGVILAGGKGSRLETSKFYNKHLALVYDKPMIEYPVETLKSMGADRAVIVSTPEGVTDLLAAYRTDINGLPVDYAIQPHPNGSADALSYARGIEGTFPVLCGDVYFDSPMPLALLPTLIYNEFEGARNHSVYDPEQNTIVEKPVRNIGNKAIVAYYYDQTVFDIIPTLQPSERGEIELIDLHNYYLKLGAPVVEYAGFFGDMGTPDGLLRVANHVKGRS